MLNNSRSDGVKHLSIVAMVADEAYCAFKYLTLQRLSSLEISCAAGRGEEVIEDIMWKEWDEQHIVDFFGRSTGSSVTSLSLRYVPISGEQLLQLLWLMPALCYLRVEESSSDQLTITNRTITQPFLQRLTIDIQDSSPSFLPKLTNIGLVLREDGLVENMLPSALISRLIPDDLKFEVGVECIKSVEVILIAASEETVGVLKSKLQLKMEGFGDLA
ncbi:hypothetical protein MPER_09481 [Moniliophthora perniciosa FA553]|nr:hypothetical protein MPER_09481 [Moniliophthora perniciosa FA553]